MERAQRDAAERTRHLGFPKLDAKSGGKLSKTTCGYCGRTFKCREHLFAHLRRMIGDARMVRGMHARHFKLVPATQQWALGAKCSACDLVFENEAAMREHYAMLGLRGWTKVAPAGAGAGAGVGVPAAAPVAGGGDAAALGDAAAVQMQQCRAVYFDETTLGTCLVCKRPDGAADTICVPCGHLGVCMACATTRTHCAVCGERTTDLITAAFNFKFYNCW